MTSDSGDERGVSDLPRRLVLCGCVGQFSRVVSTRGAYEKLEKPENLPLSTLVARHSNPTHTQLVIHLLKNPSDLIGHHLMTLTTIDHNVALLEISTDFSITDHDEYSQIPITEKPSSPLISIYLRCPSCKIRKLATLKSLDETIRCTNCNHNLNIGDWTGRTGPKHIYPIIDITKQFAIKWLRVNGWLERKTNLWVSEDKNGTVSYVDFRGHAIPRLYAYDQNGPVEKLTTSLVKARKDLLPYFERPTAQEVSSKKSKQDAILKLRHIKDPLDEEFITMAHTVVEGMASSETIIEAIKILSGALPNFDDVLKTMTPKELNKEEDINIPKCPKCGSKDFSSVVSAIGRADRCLSCGHIEVITNAENGRGTDRSRVDEPKENIDKAFF